MPRPRGGCGHLGVPEIRWPPFAGARFGGDGAIRRGERKLARERLLQAIESARQKRRAAEIAEREKARRTKSPRPAVLKRKILEEKRKRGELKKQRAKIEI